MVGFATTPPTSPLGSLLKMEGIDASYTISYRDEHGKLMSETAFAASVNQGRSFNLERDTTAHTASVSLQAKGKELNLSPQAIAAMRAAPKDKDFLKPRQPIPAFQLTGIDGRRYDNSSLRGHITLINFFFSLCGPCIAETPTLTAYAKKYPDRHVLAVTFDDAKTAKAYIADHNLNWPVLVDGMAFNQAMGVNVYPVMALVGPDGRLRKINTSSKIASKGPLPTVADLERWVDAPASP